MHGYKKLARNERGMGYVEKKEKKNRRGKGEKRGRREVNRELEIIS